LHAVCNIFQDIRTNSANLFFVNTCFACSDEKETGIRKTMDASLKVVDHLVKRIVEEVHPLKIIIFGSAARNEMKPDSDIDMLIVMPDGTHRRRTAQMLYRKIRGAGAPFDILVATPDDLEKHKDNIGLIYRSILQEGKVVYVA